MERKHERFDYDVGTDDRRAVIITDKEYVVSFRRKEYSERPLTSSLSELDDSITGQILNTRDLSSFEEVEKNGGITEFRATINNSSTSDARIFFDEAIGLPVREEFYSIDGSVRKLQYSIELTGFTKIVPPEVFQIEKGFRRISDERRK